MADTLIRDRVRVLRTQGTSLNELVTKFGVPKSTIRYWCRDIALTHVQLKRLFQKQKLGGIRAAEKLRKRRLLLTRELTEEGKKEVGKLSPRELLLVGAALYWAEGYRKGDGEFGFTNSDPNMIQFVIKWLRLACDVLPDRIHARICINEMHKRRLRTIKEYWSKITKIQPNHFSHATLIHTGAKKRYLNPSKYHGALRIKVRKSVNLRRKITGWIHGLATTV